MSWTVAYGGRTIELVLPARARVDEFAPRRAEHPLEYENFRRRFLKAGGGEFISGGSCLVIVNDAYRTTPTARILEWLDAIDHGFLDRADYIVACGSHQPPTDSQYQDIFGRLYPRLKGRVRSHDATDFSCMTALAVDALGGEVWLNDAAIKAERMLVIGSVEPHYFAGFTGGRKSLFPGLTDLATIERNHNLANSMEARPLRLRGNPVAEHLDALMELISPDRLFGVQLVLDVDRQLAEIGLGSLDRAFADASVAARRCYAVEVAEPYDIALAEVLPPLDSSLYQVQKALENCQSAVRDGGAVVLLSACREGVGSRHFFAEAAHWDRERNVPADGQWRFGSHKLSRVNAIGRRVRVFLRSELPPADVHRVFYEPLDKPDDLEFIGLSNAGRVALVHDAGNMVLSHKPV